MLFSVAKYCAQHKVNNRYLGVRLAPSFSLMKKKQKSAGRTHKKKRFTFLCVSRYLRVQALHNSHLVLKHPSSLHSAQLENLRNFSSAGLDNIKR